MHLTTQAVVLTVLLCFTGINNTLAQINLSKWQVGVNGGIFIYQGDLTPSDVGSYKTLKPVFGFYVSRVLNTALMLRTNIAIGHLSGNDASSHTPVWRQERNYRFNTRMTEISELVVWNMMGNNSGQVQRLSPYVFGGLGVSILKVNRDYSKFNYHYFASASNILNGLNADIKHSSPRVEMVIPMGLGMEFFLTPKLSITGETNFRYTFSDYLDGFSLGANPAKKDFYHSHSIGLLYRFGKSNQWNCPVIKH